MVNAYKNMEHLFSFNACGHLNFEFIFFLHGHVNGKALNLFAQFHLALFQNSHQTLAYLLA
jgi:hypothetical protein